jgi:catechol 2,3-dioxygenase-like lactoylglutathione lyase family enzyme
MITNVSLVTVYCQDQDATRDFYVDKLGFRPQDDIEMGPGFRWVTVCHPDHPELSLTLMIPGPPMDPETAELFRRTLDKGGMPGVGLTVDDCRKTYEELVAKGVTFLQEPSERPYGVEAVMRDNSGNWLVLVEPKEYSPEDFAAGS